MEIEKSKVLIYFLLNLRQSGDVLFLLYARRLRGYTATVLNARKTRKYDEKRVFFSGEESFHLFKSLPYENEKAQSMPAVAGCLVSLVNQI